MKCDFSGGINTVIGRLRRIHVLKRNPHPDGTKQMLNNFVQPASVSTGQPLEGVQSIQGFTPYNQFAQLVPAFNLPEESNKPGEEEKKEELILSKYSEQQDEKLPELFRLAMNVSFKEMIEYFLTPEHDKILDIRRKIRSDRGINRLTIIAPQGKIPEQFEYIRKHLYEFQMQLIPTPTGLHCHIIL